MTEGNPAATTTVSQLGWTKIGKVNTVRVGRVFPASSHRQFSHRSLPSLSASQLRKEVCKPQKIYRKKFGTAPTLLRPPYGNGGYPGDSSAVKRRIDATAASCGINNIVMWDVVVGSRKVEYVRAPLRRGDIVLLHFGPNLAEELKMVKKLGKRQGLQPASLTDFI